MPEAQPTDPLLQVRGLKVHFPVHAGIFRRKVGDIKAVDGVTIDVMRGETLGLVGESGCGKTTAGRAILQLCGITEGAVAFDGTELTDAKPGEIRRMRPGMQMIFQDPQASLNPRMTVEAIISEPLVEHLQMTGAERFERVCELMEAVGLSKNYADRYPHEFSGGQRQRIGIARALALDPKLIVCDEPIAALDVSIQAQVVNLLEDLQSRLRLTYLFISHDLGMVRHIADRVAVMYLGRIVELSDRDGLYGEPMHPYTEALLSAVPEADPESERRRRQIILEGDVPSPLNPPAGCRFRTRCPKAMEICRTVSPELGEVRPGRRVACHLYNPDSPGSRNPADAGGMLPH